MAKNAINSLSFIAMDLEGALLTAIFIIVCRATH